MKTVKITRKQNVSNALASLRIEKMAPSTPVLSHLRAYENGTLSASELVQEVQRRYVSLRRG